MGFACTSARQAAGVLPATARTEWASPAVCSWRCRLSSAKVCGAPQPKESGCRGLGSRAQGVPVCDGGRQPWEGGVGALLWRGSPGWAAGRVKGVLCTAPAPAPRVLISAERQFAGRDDPGAGGAHGGRARAGSQLFLGVCEGQSLVQKKSSLLQRVYDLLP